MSVPASTTATEPQTGTAAGTTAGSGSAATGSAPPATTGGVTWSDAQQAEIDRIAARARSEGREAGRTAAEQAAAEAQRTADQKALADQQQFRPLYENEQAAHNATKASFKSAAIRNAVRAAAVDKHFINPDLAMQLIDGSKAEVDESTWNVANAATLVDALIAANTVEGSCFLVKPPATGEGQQQGAGSRTQTRPIPGTPQPGATGAAGSGAGTGGSGGADREAVERAKTSLRGSGKYR